MQHELTDQRTAARRPGVDQVSKDQRFAPAAGQVRDRFGRPGVDQVSTRGPCAALPYGAGGPLGGAEG